ncbi:MAG: hypothetical protein J0I77_02110 [Rudaea sp.]|uniref:hypothetical protein n=1 Tax=unclassified Rudaea TaxID=2627037 RepID=UPI0010F81E02|nr:MULTISPECIES: hypothetical protein [unclassified Rudaea]MBN8884490.1 hypothetical protein [Rudaea sp.]
MEIVELLIAVGRLPEDKRQRREAWYESQKEHWIGWLFHYNSPGAYDRKVTRGRDARFVYNHAVCPGLLAYLADASGVARNLVRQAKRIAASPGTEMARAGAIRQVIPWEIVQASLLANGYARFVP